MFYIYFCQWVQELCFSGFFLSMGTGAYVFRDVFDNRYRS